MVTVPWLKGDGFQVEGPANELFRNIEMTKSAQMPAEQHNRFVRGFVDIFSTSLVVGVRWGPGGGALEDLFDEACAFLKRMWAH